MAFHFDRGGADAAESSPALGALPAAGAVHRGNNGAESSPVLGALPAVDSADRSRNGAGSSPALGAPAAAGPADRSHNGAESPPAPAELFATGTAARSRSGAEFPPAPGEFAAADDGLSMKVASYVADMCAFVPVRATKLPAAINLSDDRQGRSTLISRQYQSAQPANPTCQPNYQQLAGLGGDPLHSCPYPQFAAPV